MSPAPPIARDRWAWASLLGLVPVLARSIGAALGEPVAEDFDFLHSVLFHHDDGFFEGGGSLSFWRPLAHQTYYALFSGVILSRPWVVALVHTLFLGAGVLLLYRLLRRSWSGPLAAAAATFPLLTEASRTLIAWPGHFVEVGALFFAILALHEAAFRRMPTALAALLASLLCKESGVVVAALLPWMPALFPGRTSAAAAHEPGLQVPRRERGLRSLFSRERMHWMGGALAVVALWGLASLYVRRHAGLTLPHHLESDPEIAATPLPTRLVWAFGNSLRAIVSLPASPAARDWLYGAAVLVLLVVALVWLAADRRAFARLRAVFPITAWGLAWFFAFTAGLMLIYPIWAPHRVVFASLGLGVAAAALLGAIQPALVAALIAVRLVAFAASPGPPRMVTLEAPDTGAFIDFARLSRLELLMRKTRETLRARYPRLPSGALVGQAFMPWLAKYAFGDSRAIQVWYRDSTLRWIPVQDFNRHPELLPTTIVEFEQRTNPQIVLVSPEAQRHLYRGSKLLLGRQFEAALVELDRADSLQPSQAAVAFHATVAVNRASALYELRRIEAAEPELRRALRLWPTHISGRYVLAMILARQGHLREARTQLVWVLQNDPNRRGAADLLAEIDRVEGRR